MNDVLLVNDRDRILERTATLFEAMGWKVWVADTEQAVFESCVASRPEMVVVDVEMDGAIAFDCIGSARTLYPDVYIVAITRGGTDKILPGAAAVCGANRFIEGLPSSAKLSAAIQSGIDQGLVEHNKEAAIVTLRTARSAPDQDQECCVEKAAYSPTA